jgi:hypothetical protein
MEDVRLVFQNAREWGTLQEDNEFEQTSARSSTSKFEAKQQQILQRSLRRQVRCFRLHRFSSQQQPSSWPELELIKAKINTECDLKVTLNHDIIVIELVQSYNASRYITIYLN